MVITQFGISHAAILNVWMLLINVCRYYWFCLFVLFFLKDLGHRLHKATG